MDGADQLHREMRIVRLGQGVDRTGVLAAEALDRTKAALVDYAAVVDSLGVERTRMIATSAIRDARNRADFVAMVRETIGVGPEVITGREEAELSYAGAVGKLDGVGAPVLLIDLGGGSTELVLGPEPLRSHSMDVGSVRMTERHLHDDPPTPQQLAAAVADVRHALDDAARDVPLDTGATLVGVAGTITTVAAIALGLTEYDPARIHGTRLHREQIADVADLLASLDHGARAAIAAIHPGRVDVITAGAVVLRTVVERTGAAEIVVSEHDILDGVAASIRG
jgi:exopolyphosphatase/guanosine-5'-triphosphate,3'-diphosphate pyrophosphatase